jgi:hypothetical protein
MSRQSSTSKSSSVRMLVLVFFLCSVSFFGWKIYSENDISKRVYKAGVDDIDTTGTTTPVIIKKLDTALYDKKMLQLANLPPIQVNASSSTSTLFIAATSSALWPVKAVYPNYGALLPFNRIVAYYGNFYSTRMGVLGEYKEEELLPKLRSEVERWEKADPSTPVIPAIHYIAAVAQADKGSDGDYLARMPDSEIDKAIALAKKVNGIVFLDIQFGHSTLEEEVLALKKYLMLPEVHLGLDPEFAMKEKNKPGSRIGTIDAVEINQAANILADIVKENNLPPKILIVHRFTEAMVTNYKNIKPLPEVQVVIEMDGWGSPELKKATYEHVIYDEPVQFSGIKLFYKNDLRKPSTRMLTTEEILDLQPQPSYIQYQ